MKLKLSLGRRKLPDNITAKIKKFKDESEYIDLIYPEIPSTSLLKRGSVIEGKTAEDIASFIDKQADSDALKKASENIGKISDNTAKLTDQLNQILTKINNGFEQQQVSNIVSNIEKTSENIKYTTESIKNITVNIDKATKNLDESLDKNLGQIFENIKNITENVDKATKNLDKTFIKIDSTISGVNEVIYNSAVISKGFKNTLEKRFGGARIIFGTPISSKEAKINKKGNSIPPVQSTQPVPASKTIDADNIPKSTPSGCPISPRP